MTRDLMMACAVRRLVVVDSNGHACGLLSLDDIAKHGATWDCNGDIDLERVAITLGEIARVSNRTDEERPETQESPLGLPAPMLLDAPRDDGQLTFELHETCV